MSALSIANPAPSERRLTGGISGAYEIEVEPVGRACFTARRSVVDALADEPIEAVDREAAPCDASGKNDGPRPDNFLAIKENLARRRIDAIDGTRDQNFRA